MDLDLQLEDEEIKCFKREQFRNIVKNRLEKFAAKYLLQLKKSHSKTEHLRFNGFKPAEYLMTRNLTSKEVQTLFKLRTRMIDVKGNFSSAHTNNMWCKLCLLFTETQQHLLECPVLRLKTKNLVDLKEADYQMIFGTLKNQEKLLKFTKFLLKQEKIC